MSAIDNAKKHFDSLETRIIEVPEWGEDSDNPLTIYCRPITLSETSKFMKMAQDDDVQLLAYVLIYKALDEAGEKLFTIADKKTLLESVDRDVLIRVSSEMMNNISQEEIKKK
ncbi:hypothetical protein OAV94_01015 [Candidatus Pelagibacter sp.]|jgi:hypothetical protein|nr:hypothetical protein [Candidatus Pelagibacter sp.]